MPDDSPNAWIVVGSTGEYSDFICWNVCAYTSKSKAEDHAEKADQWERGLEKARMEAGISRWEISKEDNPYDPGGRRDYTGTFYTVVPLHVYGSEGGQG